MKYRNLLKLSMVAALAGTASLLTGAAAATFQWTNTASGAFLNAANWTNTTTPFANGVPAASDTGINNIRGSTTTIGTGDTVTVGTLQAPAGTISMTDGALTATTVQSTGSNGLFSVSGGTVNLANLQITANFGLLAFGGGTTTVTTDSRIGAANGVWNVTGGTLNLSKVVLGSAAANNINNVMTISGSASVTQNQGIGGGANRELWIGGNNAGSGTLILKDNATWTSSAANGSTDVIVGRAASAGQAPVGILTVQDNASLVVQAGGAAAKVIRVADISTSASGTINLNGGNIYTIGIQRISGTGIINANGGKITALAASANFFNNFTGTGGNNSVNLQSGGLSFDTGGNAVTLSNVLSGAGGLTAQGGSILTLAATNTYSGATVVNDGTLKLAVGGSINSTASISNNTSSTLDVSTASAQLATAGALTLNDATLVANLFTTNITVGTLGTAGSVNTLNLTALPVVTSLPTRIRVIKYSAVAPGLVDGNNVLTTLGVVLPSVSSPAGYLTNNTVSGSIDLVITNMVLAPVITQQPQPDSAYAGYFAHFSVQLEATNAPGYVWRKGGTPLSNGGHISGATTAVLRLSNVSAADVASYDVVITNVSGAVTSSVAGLTLAVPTGYEAAAVAAGPVALYMFDDTGDPATNNSPAFDFAGDLDGIYGIAAQNGSPNYNIAGPRPVDGFIGFDPTNLAVHFFGLTPESHVTIPPLNLNTNTVTLAAWINPGSPAPNAGVIFCRGAGTTAGMNFTTSFDGSSYRTLGYTWNNDVNTFSWNSQIAPPPGLWSFVALVITPTNATVYIFNTNGLLASSLVNAHANQSFSVNTLIGEDSFGGNRQFDGSVDGVAVYGTALSQSQLETLYSAGSGVNTFAPIIFSQPASQNLYEQQTAVLAAKASGTQPLSYQWQKLVGGNYVNVTDDARLSGSTTASLTISNVAMTDATDYIVVVTNVVTAVTSSVATLTVNPAGPAEAITNAVVEVAGTDWNTGTAWSDGNPAWLSAASKPGSTYHVVPGGGLRTPNITSSTNFPGDVLSVHGNGVYDTTFTTAGGLILKGQSPGATFFKKLVLDGGMILSFTDNNNPTILSGGELNVIGNVPISTSSSTSGRSITITAQLTGNGNVEYRGFNNATFQPTFVTALNIAGANNSYTGTWNVLGGTLVGSVAGALGTNTITVATNGALQTSYDLNNPSGDLVLNGRMNLTQNDTFRTVTINGVSLAAGAYPFSQLTNAYPGNFPASWLGQTGAESFTNGAGSITVLASPIASYPTNITFNASGGSLSLTWPATHLGWIAQSNIVGVANPNSWFDIANSQAGTSLNITMNRGATNVYYRLRHP